MKKFLLMAVAAFMFTVGAHAQTQQKVKDTTRKEMRQHHEKSPYARLDLTQAQKDEMQKMRQENMSKREAIKNDKNLTDAQRSEKMKELRKGQKAKMNSVLTKEQKEKMKANQQKRKMNGKKAERKHMNGKKWDGKKMHQRKMNRTDSTQ